MPKNKLGTVVSFGAFLFFASMLSMPRGYTVGAVVLLLAALYHLTQRPFVSLSREDKRIIWLMIGVFAVGVFSFLYHGNPPRSLDLPSRYLLTVPILLVLIRCPPDVRWVWAAMAVGSVSAAAVAWWDIHVLDLPRATGQTGGIQFGNLGLMMGVFCLAGAVQAFKSQEHKLWRVLLVLGAVAGVYVSIASGSRGGWVALPFIGIVFAVAYTARHNAKYVFGVAVASAVAAFVALTTVPAIETRYEQAVEDIEQYKNGDPYTSLGLRLAMYEAMAVIIPQKPWLGWGHTDYGVELKQQVQSGVLSDAVLGLANTHNTFLEVWVYQGMLGLIALLMLLLAAFVYFARRLRVRSAANQAAAVCGASLIIGYAVASLTQVMLGRNNTVLFFLIGIAVFWAMAKNAAPGKVER